MQFKPLEYCRLVMVTDPGVKRQTLARRVKITIKIDDTIARREEAEALPCQSQMLWDSSLPVDLVCTTAVSRLGSEDMKFALNAATDTLPQNSNLARWNGGLHSGLCKLCGKKQVCLHCLNSCEIALELHRYNRRHD